MFVLIFFAVLYASHIPYTHTTIKKITPIPIVHNNQLNSWNTNKRTPFMSCPLYICPAPVTKNERTAANPSFLLDSESFACWTPQFGHTTASLSISVPQWWQYFTGSLYCPLLFIFSPIVVLWGVYRRNNRIRLNYTNLTEYQPMLWLSSPYHVLTEHNPLTIPYAQ